MDSQNSRALGLFFLGSAESSVTDSFVTSSAGSSSCLLEAGKVLLLFLSGICGNFLPDPVLVKLSFWRPRDGEIAELRNTELVWVSTLGLTSFTSCFLLLSSWLRISTTAESGPSLDLAEGP